MRAGLSRATIRLLRLYSRDRLKDSAGDLIGISLRIGPAIFEVSTISVVNEAVRDADRSAAIRDTVVKFVNRLRLVQTGQAQVIVRSINGNMLVLVLVECGH